MDAQANLPNIEVLITISFPEELVSNLRALSPRLNVTLQPARRPEDLPAEVWNRVEVLYTDRVLPTPEQAPKLRWLQFHSAGIDFAVNSPLLQKPNVSVTTLSGAAAPHTAEYCLTMLLALSHRLPDLLSAQSHAEWSREPWQHFIPKELRGSTVGIIGYGSVGRELARLLQPFGTTILAAKYDAMHPEDTGYTAEGLGDPGGNLFNRLYPYQAIRSMVKLCDFVVIAVPLTNVTRGMFGAAELEAMKPGSFLLVVGRGSVVDENALIEALQQKQIGGAALDVFQEEPLSPTNPLWRQPNLITTPHISGMSSYYDKRAMALFCENMKRYLTNTPLFNNFNPNRGY